MAIYQQINLYQPIFRKQRQIFSAVTLAEAAGVVAFALLAVYVYGLWQVRGLEDEAAKLEGQEKALTAQLARLDPSLGSSRRAEVDAELKRLNATLLEQQRLIDALREQPLGTTSGFSGYLAALGRQRTPLLWLTDLSINGGTQAIELAGRSLRAELVPEYLQHLGTEPALAGQRFDRLDIERAKDTAEIAFHATSEAAASPPETLAGGRP
jgi:Tfp pilus assembly protein PilN